MTLDEADWERMKARIKCSVASAERTKAVCVGEMSEDVGRPKRRGLEMRERSEVSAMQTSRPNSRAIGLTQSSRQ